MTNWTNFLSQLSIAVVTATIAATIAICGWYQTNKYTVERDHQNREKEARIAYLVDAYEKLALSANRQLTPEFSRMIEEAVAKIQLFGTPEEIGLLHAFLDEWSKTEARGQPSGTLDPLLKQLRNRLRAELSLPPIPSDRDAVRWLRPEGGAALSPQR